MLGHGYLTGGETARPGGRFAATASELWRFLAGNRARKALAVCTAIWVLLWLYNLVQGNAHDKVVGWSMFICIGATGLAWTYRDVLAAWARKWNASPRTKFIVIGGLGAAFAEYVFWQMEKLYGITGVAANPNLGIDLLVTMPWYIMMVALLWKVQTRYRFGFVELFVLGGVYELGADGLVGSIMEGTFSAITVPALIALIPFFSMVYAVMVIPCSAILKDEIEAIRSSRPPATGNRYLYAMLPWLGLIPYFVLAFLMVLG
jgi:hypothetical protein